MGAKRRSKTLRYPSDADSSHRAHTLRTVDYAKKPNRAKCNAHSALGISLNSSSLLAIDVHGHYGHYVRSDLCLLKQQFMSGDPSDIVGRATVSNILYTVVSPLTALMPRGGGDTFTGNLEAARIVTQTPGLLQYVVIDPRDERTYRQADEMLQQPQCVGIKIHPEEHCYPILEYGRSIFKFAADRKAVVLSHSSEQNSLASDFVPFANEFPEVSLILAHIGCGWDGDPTHQVRAIQKCRHGNVYADTSSASSITPRLIEWAVKEIGAERILFGTDTPLYFTAMQRARIDHADLSDKQKQMIFLENARRILPISDEILNRKECC